MKDYHSDSDTGIETNESSPKLSETGQRAMQGRDIPSSESQEEDIAALERRVEQLRTETEAREAAERTQLEQDKTESLQMQSQQTNEDASQTSLQSSPEHQYRPASTEHGTEVRTERGTALGDREWFPDKTEPKESEISIPREGRLR